MEQSDQIWLILANTSVSVNMVEDRLTQKNAVFIVGAFSTFSVFNF